MNNKYHLRLYIAGISPENQTMIVNLKDELKDMVGDQFRLEVIDILENPHIANEESILATPTIARISPLPIKKVIFNFKNLPQAVVGFSLILDKENVSGRT